MSNLKDLKQVLFDTLLAVKEGDITPQAAKAVVEISNSMVEVYRVELDALVAFSRMSGDDADQDVKLILENNLKHTGLLEGQAK